MTHRLRYQMISTQLWKCCWTTDAGTRYWLIKWTTAALLRITLVPQMRCNTRAQLAPINKVGMYIVYSWKARGTPKRTGLLVRADSGRSSLPGLFWTLLIFDAPKSFDIIMMCALVILWCEHQRFHLIKIHSHSSTCSATKIPVYENN